MNKDVKKITKRKITKSELRRILVEAEFDVMSNDNAELFYRCPRTHQELNLREYGTIDSISFDMLQTMKQTARSFLEKYWIVIVDVYIPNSDKIITVEEIYDYLGLSKVYKEISKTFDKVNDLRELMLESDMDLFRSKVVKMDKQMLNKLISLAVELYDNEELKDHNKIAVLKELVDDNEFLFKPKKKK